ncbi:MAG: TIGR01244 family sulfur transferase [Kangiellaceae bacterium]|nr:TIGR01244 family sulfur transferase [Kangiellaceae bacterium]
MNLQQLHDNFSISEQITLEDIKTLAAHGVKTIICNRPDGEEPNQIACAEIKATAEANGINFVHIPVPGRDVPAESLQEFMCVIEENDSKVHAYCRTGTRSSIFWQLSQQD